MDKKGFTLIELLIVIVIIAVLAGAMVPVFRTTKNNAKITKAWQDMEAVKKACQLFNIDTGIWPSLYFECSFDALMVNKDANNHSIPGWGGPYLDRSMFRPDSDPWGNSYGQWDFEDNGTKILAITCVGPDGLMDNSDDFDLIIAQYK